MSLKTRLKSALHLGNGSRIQLKTTTLTQVCTTESLTVNLRKWRQDLRAGDIFDSVTLAGVARTRQPEVYFEIGTGDGRSSLLVAANTSDSAKLFTLDPFYPEDPVKGSVFRGEPESQKIQQLGGSSMTFDFNPWYGKTDLVFVDGAHDFESVRSDTATAFRLVSSRGWILWHDVDLDTPGVVRALESSERSQSIQWIKGTRYAIYRP